MAVIDAVNEVARTCQSSAQVTEKELSARSMVAANVTAVCFAGTECLVHKNESWIGFVRYKLTNWVNLQAEYIHSRDQNTIGRTNADDAVVAGTTFFW